MTRPPWRCTKHGVDSVEIGALWGRGRRGKAAIRVCPMCHAEAVARIKLETGRQRRGKRLSA